MTVLGIIILIVLVGVVLMYALCGPISFIFNFLGILYSGFVFPIELVNRFIYPVGVLPSLVWYGGVMFLVFIIVARMIKFFVTR